METKHTATQKWRKLDNAAKVFPATANKQNTKVFRFYCELNEAVIQENLQQALEMTLEKFPLFKSVLRRGLFWFYLEENEYKPEVREEYKPPCSPLYAEDRIKYLFRVNYYKNRINFEVFHVLTDGTGATEFLRVLVKNYLYITHKEEGLPEISLLDHDLTHGDQVNDGFSKYYSDKASRKEKKNKEYKQAHQIRGLKSEFATLQVVEGVVETKALLAKAKEYGVSITVLITAIFICAIHDEMSVRQENKPVVMMIPVNLRNFFPSKSMMNFFGYVEPYFNFSENQESNLEMVIEVVKNYFVTELTEENMSARMNEYTRLEKNPLLRLTPLEMKNLGIQAGFAAVVKDITAIFSNMGIVKMPAEYESYIKQFGVFTSTHKLELCSCSYKDRMVLNFTSYFESENIQRNFFRILQSIGVEAERTQEPFPEINEEEKRGVHFQQCLNYVSIVLIVIDLMWNILVVPDTMWSWFGIGIVGSMWLTVTMGFRKRRNLLKNCLHELWIVSAGSILWDIVVDGYRGWSFDYIIPGLTIATLVFMVIMSRVQKLKAEEYMMYMVSAGIYGLLPALFIVIGLAEATACAVLCVGVSVLVLSFQGIFKKRALVTELHKKFHI